MKKPTTGNPILNGPYDEPAYHYSTDANGTLNYDDIRESRRIAPDVRAPSTTEKTRKIHSMTGGLPVAASSSRVVAKCRDRRRCMRPPVRFRIAAEKGKKIAVRVASQFGEESTKVLAGS